MIYNLKTDNYKSFDVFSENLLKPRSYFIPFASEEQIDNASILNERYCSSAVKCLSGDDWRFRYYKKVSDMPDSFDTKDEMDELSVPSTWQHTGYEPPYYVNIRYQFPVDAPNIPEDCPVGVYVKTFNIENPDLNFILSFLGVAGSLDLFCNGKYVGYSEGSHNTAEFELNDFVVKGENEIAVVVHKWCNGTYLECQDMFRCNGIFRDVLLFINADNSIYDFEAKTQYNGDGLYSLDVIPVLKLVDDCEFCAAVFDGSDCISSKSVNVNKKNVDKITFSDLKVGEWSAERPKLYDLVITLLCNGKALEIIRRPIGFKHIEIKGNVFYFNGKNIKLLGVNHHDTNPKTGYVMTAEDMKHDVEIFKDYNVNCVRTSHYPPDPTFLDLCDLYGIYVVDEADIETHGMNINHGNINRLSHDLAWKEHYYDRVYRMYQRDKNHAGITMWSLGNESGGYACQDYCYDNLKALTDVPIHYEAVCRTKRWAYDVASQMYTWPKAVERIAAGKGMAKKYYRVPYFLCEYAHAMGVGAGDLDKYITAFYAGDNMLGGCIWEFADHAVYHPDGPFEYTYGGDHGELLHDSNFCVDGLFYPDRTPHAGALQMKNAYRPVRAQKSGDNSYTFKSYRRFVDCNFDLEWQVLSDGTRIAGGKESLNIAPGETEDITFDYNIADRQRCHDVIIFEYFENGESVAFEQFVLNDFTPPLICPKLDPPEIQISENKLFIDIDNGQIIFNATTGMIDSFTYKGNQFINPTPLGSCRGIGVSLFRAPLDNDMNMKKNWLWMGLDNETFAVSTPQSIKTAYQIKNNAVSIKCTYKLLTPKRNSIAAFAIEYLIYRSGKIGVKVTCNSTSLILQNIPRFGAVMEMPMEYDNVRYYGQGPKQSLCDFDLHCRYGIYETSVSNMHEPYIKPQESSMRTGTRFGAVTNAEGVGLRFDAVNEPFIFSADHYTSALCQKAQHKEELIDFNTTCVHIDHLMMGAGSNSCGPTPSNESKIGNLASKSFVFSMEPVELGKVGDTNV